MNIHSQQAPHHIKQFTYFIMLHSLGHYRNLHVYIWTQTGNRNVRIVLSLYNQNYKSQQFGTVSFSPHVGSHRILGMYA